MNRWFIILSALAVAAFVLGTPGFALAQDHGPVVKERVGIMKSVSRTLKALKKHAKAGKVGAKDAARIAAARAKFKKFTKLFPVGSHSGAGSHSGKVKTRAKKALWEEWAKFEAQAGKLIAALKGVQAAAAAGDAGATGKAVKAAYGLCKACHKPFRGPKPKT